MTHARPALLAPLPPPQPQRRRALQRRLAAALALLPMALAWAPAARADALPPTVARALSQAQLPAEALGAVVLPAAGGAGGWQHQADRVMQPASTLKLVTSAVALDRLGANLRGFTELLSAAPLRGDVLAGDLVLRGGADPEFDLPQLWQLLLELRHHQGVREIAGDIVVDRTLFRPARPLQPPAAFDERPEFAYNLVPDALQLNSHILHIELASDAAGRVQARALPPLPGLEIDASALKPGNAACSEWRRDWQPPLAADEPAPGTLRVRLQGAFPRNCTQRPGLHLVEPMALAERQIRWVWASLGGQWAGRLREAESPVLPLQGAAQQATAPVPPAGPGTVLPGVQRGNPAAAAGPRLLASHESRPWGELLRTVNKLSVNVWARLLYLQLGVPAMADNPGATTAELADRAVRQWLAQQGIEAPGFAIDNGSGLSRSERITPRALAQVLQAALRGRFAPDFAASLPLAGVDGTLRNRLQQGQATGNARLKTGLLRDVRALAGTVSDPQGRSWVLVAFVNHERAIEGRPVLDALVEWVAAGGLGDAPAQGRRATPPARMR